MTEDGYQKLANKKDFQGDNRLVRVELNGKPIVLSTVNGKVYAMDAVCSHEGGPLEDGSLEGYELKCPWHYAIFDVRNPKVSEETVWATDLKSYSVKVDQVSGDIMAFKSKKDRYPEYKAGQFAFFPLDTVNNDSRDPVRHFSLASLLSDINNCNYFLVLA